MNEFLYKNTSKKKIELSIEPLCESFFLEEGEELIISVEDNLPALSIDVEEAFFEGEKIIIIIMNNNYFSYKTEVRKYI
ncbi:hypothetical protein MHTCC0001_36500 [Flavobacteriaceae bacterium MHTCC 0001]